MQQVHWIAANKFFLQSPTETLRFKKLCGCQLPQIIDWDAQVATNLPGHTHACFELEDGHLIHRLNGFPHRCNDIVLHSVTHPAVLRTIPHNAEEWWLDGKRHRNENDGAAITTPTGYAYYDNGVKHRSNGRIAISNTSRMEWWHHGHLMRYEDYNKNSVSFLNKNEDIFCHVLESTGISRWFKKASVTPEDDLQLVQFDQNGNRPGYVKHDYDDYAIRYSDGNMESWRDGVFVCNIPPTY